MGFFSSIWSGVQSIGHKLQNGLQKYSEVGKGILQSARQVVKPLKNVAVSLKPLGVIGDGLIDGFVSGLDVVDSGLNTAIEFIDKNTKNN